MQSFLFYTVWTQMRCKEDDTIFFCGQVIQQCFGFLFRTYAVSFVVYDLILFVKINSE